jgi:hypothetical protein
MDGDAQFQRLLRTRYNECAKIPLVALTLQNNT